MTICLTLLTSIISLSGLNHPIDSSPHLRHIVADVRVVSEAFISPPGINFWNPDDGIVCGNHVTLIINADDSEGSYTIVYRSLDPEIGFEHAYTMVDPGFNWYTDENLLPRRLYYYKARTFRGDDASDFSEVVSSTSGSGFHDPVITAKVLDNNTVEITIEDRSFLDYYYEILGVHVETGDITFSDRIHLPDSGGIGSLYDGQVVYNNAYRYYANAVLTCGGGYLVSDVASYTITIPEPLSGVITTFALVDAQTDEDVYQLYDNAEFESASRFNIRANASPKTQSVQFFLNGKRFVENEPPYVLYGDRLGNYNRGRLKPGYYTLRATPWSKNNCKGAKGNTVTIHFTVLGTELPAGRAVGVTDSVEISITIFPNPADDSVIVELRGTPREQVVITVTDDVGNKLRDTMAVLDNLGYLKMKWDVREFGRRLYYWHVRIGNRIISKRVLID